MKTYIVKSVETCPTCLGDYLKPNPEYDKISDDMIDAGHYIPDKEIACEECDKGKLITDISLKSALEDLLGSNLSNLRSAISEHIRY